MEVGATDALRHRGTNGSAGTELEIGATDILRRHPTVHLAGEHVQPVPDWILAIERHRPRFVRELFAEFLGVFMYVYGGVSALAAFTLTSAAKEEGLGSLLNAAFGFAFGISFAIIIAAGTSGGHLNPAMTFVFASFRGFPWRKVPFYIVAQILGSLFACSIVYAQWHQQIKQYEAALKLLGQPLISATGPAGIFVAIPLPTQSNRWIFCIEFFADTFIGLVIWAALDPNNPFMTPSVAPFTIGFAYFTMILGFGPATLSTNTARDLGARIFAAAAYGGQVFTMKSGYAAIAILTNIPATFFGVLIYQVGMGESARLIKKGHAVPAEVHRVLTRERAKMPNGEISDFELHLRKRATQQDDPLEKHPV